MRGLKSLAPHAAAPHAGTSCGTSCGGSVYVSQLELLRLHAKLASGWWLAFAERTLTRGVPFNLFRLITYIAFSFPRLFLARWHGPTAQRPNGPTAQRPNGPTAQRPNGRTAQRAQRYQSKRTGSSKLETVFSPKIILLL